MNQTKKTEKINKEETIRKFENFIKNLKKEDKIALLHHTDGDGVCSGVIAAKAIERIVKKIDLRLNQRHNEYFISKNTVGILRKNKVNKLIITDLMTDQFPETLNKAAEFCDTLIIDHHPKYTPGWGRTTIVKAEDLGFSKEPFKYVTSKMCHDLFSQLTDVSDLDWVVSIGIISDVVYDAWKDFVDKTMEKYGIETKEKIMETDFGKIAILATAINICEHEKISEIFWELYNADNYASLLKSDLMDIKKTYEKERDYWINNFEKLAEVHGNVAFYKVNSKYKMLVAPLISALSIENPHLLIIGIQEADEKHLKMSLRRRDLKIDAGKLAEEAIERFKDARAGGHIPAAGATIRKEDLEEFKKRILELTGNV